MFDCDLQASFLFWIVMSDFKIVSFSLNSLAAIYHALVSPTMITILKLLRFCNLPQSKCSGLDDRLWSQKLLWVLSKVCLVESFQDTLIGANCRIDLITRRLDTGAADHYIATAAEEDRPWNSFLLAKEAEEAFACSPLIKDMTIWCDIMYTLFYSRLAFHQRQIAWWAYYDLDLPTRWMCHMGSKLEIFLGKCL